MFVSAFAAFGSFPAGADSLPTHSPHGLLYKELIALTDDKAKENEGTRDFIFLKKEKNNPSHLLLKDTLQIESVQTSQVFIMREPIRGESCSCGALCVILGVGGGNVKAGNVRKLKGKQIKILGYERKIQLVERKGE